MLSGDHSNLPKIKRRKLNQDTDELLRQALGRLLSQLIDEDIGEDDALTDWFEANKDAIYNHLAYGYWYAENRRYRGKDSYDVFLTRKTINELKDKISRFDLRATFTLSYDFNSNASIKEEYEY